MVALLSWEYIIIGIEEDITTIEEGLQNR